MTNDIGIGIGLEGLQKYFSDLNQVEKRSVDAMNSVGKATDKPKSSIQQLGEEIPGLGRAFRLLKNPITIAAAAITGLVAAGARFVRSAAEYEATEKAFSVLTGSLTNAKLVLQDIADLASETPFELPELENSARKLIAFGVANEDIKETLRQIGDISAGTGNRIAEIAEIYGKARVQGRLFAEDINQLTGRGIPIIQELAKQFGVADSEIRQLVTDGKVGFPELQTAFQSLTTEGGKFGGLMAEVSTTLNGISSNTSDEFERISRALGQRLLPLVKPVAAAFAEIVTSIREFIEVPLSDTIRDQQVEFNALIGTLQRGNLTTNEAQKITNKLNREYGDYIGFTLEAAANTETLAKARVSANKAFEDAIRIQALNEVLAEQTSEFAKLERQIIETEIQISKIQDGSLGFGEGVGIGLVTGAQNSEQAIKALQVRISGLRDDQRAIGTEIDRVNSVLGDQVSVLKETETEVTKTGKGFGKTKDEIKAAEGSLKDLQDRLSKVNKELSAAAPETTLFNEYATQAGALEDQIDELQAKINILKQGGSIGEIQTLSGASIPELSLITNLDLTGNIDLPEAEFKDFFDTVEDGIGKLNELGVVSGDTFSTLADGVVFAFNAMDNALSTFEQTLADVSAQTDNFGQIFAQTFLLFTTDLLEQGLKYAGLAALRIAAEANELDPATRLALLAGGATALQYSLFAGLANKVAGFAFDNANSAGGNSVISASPQVGSSVVTQGFQSQPAAQQGLSTLSPSSPDPVVSVQVLIGNEDVTEWFNTQTVVRNERR